MKPITAAVLKLLVVCSLVMMVPTSALAFEPPVADAGPDQTVIVNTLVTLDGSGSYDPDNDPIEGYSWALVSGPEGVVLDQTDPVHPTFTPTTTGTYLFQLIVTDGIFDSEPDFVEITVVPPPTTAAPGLNQWGIMIMAAILIGTGFWSFRRRESNS
jgi:hypothetical protein